MFGESGPASGNVSNYLGPKHFDGVKAW